MSEGGPQNGARNGNAAPSEAPEASSFTGTPQRLPPAFPGKIAPNKCASDVGIEYRKYSKSQSDNFQSDVTCVPKIASLRFSLSRSRSDLRPIEEARELSRQVEQIPTRACRIRVNIIAVRSLKKGPRDPEVKFAILKLKVENRVLSSNQIRLGAAEVDGSVKVNQSFTFDVKDPNHAVLSVEVATRTSLGGERGLGICSDVQVAALLDHSGGEDAKAKWYDLFSKRGALMPGKVLMDIIAGIAEPEHKISVFLGTWNVGNTRPGDLSSWLPTKNEHELLVVGAQECEYSPRQPFTDCAKDWIHTIKSCVGTRYKLICATSRWQIRLAAFVRDDAEKAISEVDTGSEATGVGHWVANKGAVCVAFKYWDTDLCFVNSHLAAHAGYCEVRNSNYREIVENMHIGFQGMDILSKFHHVIWMGDLNYRLDFGNPDDKAPDKALWQKVVDQISAADYSLLLEHDELRKEIAASRAFHGFTEAQIAFAPTFKVIRDSVSTYSEKRLPAWCDRILCRSLDGCDLEVTSYFSAPEICTSDHKPVGATVSLTAYALPTTNFDADGRKWHIIFTSLEAQGLKSSDINGFSDPYVSFGGANLVSGFDSKVKFRTLNPVWDPPKDLPKLVVVASSLHRLEHEYVMCHVLDYDYASANDTLGYGAIPLRGLVNTFKKNPDEAAPFQIELLHRGLPAGILKGGMKLTWERSLVKQKSIAAGLFGRTLTFRKSFKKAIFAKEYFH